MDVQGVKFMVTAQDMSRAVAFYRDAVGLQLRFESPFWSELAWRDAVVALHGGGTGERVDTGLGFEVADVDAACRELAAAGATVAKGPEDRPQERIRIAEVVDPEGNAFTVAQPLS